MLIVVLLRCLCCFLLFSIISMLFPLFSWYVLFPLFSGIFLSLPMSGIFMLIRLFGIISVTYFVKFSLFIFFCCNLLDSVSWSSGSWVDQKLIK